MKKLAALSLALLLALSLTAATAETYAAGSYYTIDYPETLTLDNTSYTDESSADYEWLFMLTGEDYLIDASLSPVSDYEGFSLYSATEDEKQAYVEDTLSAYSDESAVLTDTLTTGEGVPFYIFTMEDSDGVYLYAETIANGQSVNFCCYYNDGSAAPDDTLLGYLRTVLETFRKGAPSNSSAITG
ncbi:MAG: hypothetical protein GX418_15420 [Clostridiales bacterium]|nr:hypothetical protein [Clostridiales bacterium]